SSGHNKAGPRNSVPEPSIKNLSPAEVQPRASLPSELPGKRRGGLPLHSDAVQLLRDGRADLQSDPMALQRAARENPVRAHVRLENIAAVVGLEIRRRRVVVRPVKVAFDVSLGAVREPRGNA